MLQCYHSTTKNCIRPGKQSYLFLSNENADSDYISSTMSHMDRISAFEATSFMNKFKDLWNSGQQATLHLEAKAGQAWATISVALGSFPDNVQKKKNVKPSQHRRRERRHAARTAAEVVQANSVNPPPCAAEEANSIGINTNIIDEEASKHEHHLKSTEAEQVSLGVIDQAKSNSIFIEDEIELTEMSDEVEKECAIDALVQIEGEFKNPKLKPWTHINPEEEVKIMWDVIKNESDMKGIEDIGEASATFEHYFEFWGTWRVKKPGITLKYLENSKNWSKGMKITKIKHA